MHTKAKTSVGGAFAFVIFSTITGCAGIAFEYPNQPAVPVGSLVQLNLDAEVPIDQNRIYIQNRTIVSRAQIDEEAA